TGAAAGVSCAAGQVTGAATGTTSSTGAGRTLVSRSARRSPRGRGVRGSRARTGVTGMASSVWGGGGGGAGARARGRRAARRRPAPRRRGRRLPPPPRLLQEAVQVGGRAPRRQPLGVAGPAAVLLPLVLQAAEDRRQDPHPQGDERDQQDGPVHGGPPG